MCTSKRRQLQVLIYRPPWRNNEPYFRAQQVASYLKRNGDRVFVVAGPRGWRSLIRLLSWFWYLLRVDLIFLYPQPLLPFFILMARLFKRRVIIDHYVSYIHFVEVSPRWGRWMIWLEKAAYVRADAVFAHTRSVAEAIQASCNIPEEKLHIIYSLVDTTLFSPTANHDTNSRWLRQKLGLMNQFVVLYHGLWHPWHGLEILRAAVAKLVDGGEAIALVLIGRAGQGAKHERLLGEVPYRELPDYIQMADVWCSGFVNLPRGDRSFGSTMIQAMAMARPVITSPSPEKQKWLRHGENVFFVPPNHHEELAEGILFCKHNFEDTLRVGLAGRDAAQRIFDLNRFHLLLEDLVQAWFCEFEV